MEKKTFGILAILVTALLFVSAYGFILVSADIIPTLASSTSMHVAALSGPAGINPSILNPLNGCSFCVCIPIPLALGFFALSQRAKHS